MRRGRRVNHGLDTPVYRQVADDLRQQIKDGDLQPGEKLPGEADLAHEYGVGINSLKQALQILRAEGLILTERAVGSYVRPLEEKVITVTLPGTTIRTRSATAEDRAAGISALLVFEITIPGGPVQVVGAEPGTVICVKTAEGQP